MTYGGRPAATSFASALDFQAVKRGHWGNWVDQSAWDLVLHLLHSVRNGQALKRCPISPQFSQVLLLDTSENGVFVLLLVVSGGE